MLYVTLQNYWIINEIIFIQKIMNTVFLLLGGNLGDREYHLNKAIEHLKLIGCLIIKYSSIYETAAWGKTDEPSFLNQVIKVSTILTADTLMENLIRIEEEMGRVRTYKNASRIIDIDILFYNEEVIDISNLTIPHPEITNRQFVLVPLNEIAPEFVHPIFLKSNSQLLKECTDHLPVNLFQSKHPKHN